MPHKIILGFKQNPTLGVDDCIDLGGGGNVNNTGYFNHGYLESDIQTNDFGLWVRDITINTEIKGSTIADALAKYHAIDRFIQQTIEYLKDFQGNYAGTTDGTWYDGFCASLTFQPSGGTSPVYWDVLGGSITRDETYLGEDLVGATIMATVTLTVRFSARGALVTMCNLVAMGSFEPPFDPQDSYYCDDWVFTNTAVWSVDRTAGKFGLNALKWVGVASTTAFTNENIDIYDYNPAGTNTLIPYVSASIWLKASGVTGSTLIELQKYDGSAWSTIGTLANVAGNLASWSYYKIENVALVSGTTKVRLKFTTPTAGTVYFDGVAIWRSATVPANGEYFTSGLKVMFPSTYLYGAIGDTHAPCILHVGYPTNGVGGPTVAYAGLMVGAREYKWKSTGRDSIPGLATKFANGSANTALFWGKNGQSDVGSASSISFFGAPAANLLNPIIRTARKYRALLSINTNQAITKTSIYLTQGFAVGPNLVINKTIPSTAGVEDLVDLGDLIFPSFNSGIQNQIYQDITVSGTVTTGVNVTFDVSGGSHTIKFGGLILIPAEMFGFVEGGNYTKWFNSMADPEFGTIMTAVGMRANYAPSLAVELVTKVTDKSDILQVIPGAMQFEIIAFTFRSTLTPDLYPYTGTDQLTPTLVYQPRYLSGGM